MFYMTQNTRSPSLGLPYYSHIIGYLGLLFMKVVTRDRDVICVPVTVLLFSVFSSELTT